MIPEYCALLNMPAVRYREELPNKRSVWVCLNKTSDSNRQGQRALMRASRCSGLRGAPAGKGPNRAADPAPRADADASRYAREEGRSCHHQTPPPPWLWLAALTCYLLPVSPTRASCTLNALPGRWCHSPCRAPPASRGMEKCFHLAEFFKLGICDGLLLHQDTDGTHRERCAIAFVWKKIINNTGSQGRTAELLNHVLFF